MSFEEAKMKTLNECNIELMMACKLGSTIQIAKLFKECKQRKTIYDDGRNIFISQKVFEMDKWGKRAMFFLDSEFDESTDPLEYDISKEQELLNAIQSKDEERVIKYIEEGYPLTPKAVRTVETNSLDSLDFKYGLTILFSEVVNNFFHYNEGALIKESKSSERKALIVFLSWYGTSQKVLDVKIENKNLILKIINEGSLCSLEIGMEEFLSNPIALAMKGNYYNSLCELYRVMKELLKKPESVEIDVLTSIYALRLFLLEKMELLSKDSNLYKFGIRPFSKSVNGVHSRGGWVTTNTSLNDGFKHKRISGPGF